MNTKGASSDNRPRQKRRLRLASRLHALLLPLFILHAALGIFTIFLVLHLNNIFQEAIEESQVLNRHVDAAQQLSERLDDAIYQVLDSPTPENREIVFRAWERLKLFLYEIEANAPAQFAEDFGERFNPLCLTGHDVVREYRENSNNASLLGALQETNDRMQVHLSLAQQETALLIEHNYQRFRELVDTALLVAGMGVALASMLVVVISRRITTQVVDPLEGLRSRIESVARGDLNAIEEPGGTDEIGQLGHSFNRMVEELRGYRELHDQRLLNTLRTFRNLLHRTPNPTFFIDDQRTVFFRNPEAERLLASPECAEGFPAPLSAVIDRVAANQEPVVGHRLEDAISFKVYGEDRHFLPTIFSVSLVDPNDEERSAAPRQGWAILLQDVTLLQLSDRLRANLVSTVSHELKTPLTSARMSLCLLEEQQIGELNEDQMDLLRTAREDLERQLAMIQNMLDLTRAEQRREEMERQPFSLRTVAQSAVDAHRSLAGYHDASLRCAFDDQDATVIGDQHRVRVVVNSLLANAIQRAPEGSEIQVQLQENGSHCRLAVSDEGTPVEAGKISKKLSCSDDSRITGVLLGLTIAKEIIVAHGGEVGCGNEDGRAEFYFTLPVDAET